MTRSRAFNKMMKEFIHELRAAWPGDPKLKELADKFRKFKVNMPEMIVTSFWAVVEPSREKIGRRDPTFITDDTGKFFDGSMQLAHLWDQADDETRDTIWEYLAALTALADPSTEVPVDEDRSLATVSDASLAAAPSPDDLKKLLDSVDVNKLMGTATQMLQSIDPKVINSLVGSIAPALSAIVGGGDINGLMSALEGQTKKKKK